MCSQKHNYVCLTDVTFLITKYYIFRPAVAIIRFFHLKQLRLFYIIRVTACWCRDLNIKPVLEHNTPYTGCVGEPLKYYITM